MVCVKAQQKHSMKTQNVHCVEDDAALHAVSLAFDPHHCSLQPIMGPGACERDSTNPCLCREVHRFNCVELHL